MAGGGSTSEQPPVHEPLTHARFRRKIGASTRAGAAQLGDDTVAVGHEDHVPAADVA